MIIVEFEVWPCEKNKNKVSLKAKKFCNNWNSLLHAASTSGACYVGSSKSWDIAIENLDLFVQTLTSFNFEVKLYWCFPRPNPERDLKFCRIHEKFDSTLLQHPPIKGKAPYENYQAEDLEKAINQNRFLFNCGTGTGKSYYLSYLIERAYSKGISEKFLILTTKVGCLNLKKELLKFTKSFKDEDIYVLDSITLAEDRAIFTPDKKIIVLNYDTFRRVADHYYYLKTGKSAAGVNYRGNVLPTKQWLGDKPGFLLLDESHNISNPKSKQFKILDAMCKDGGFYYRYEFTGTFAPKFEHMYAQLHTLDPYITKHSSYQEWCGLYNNLGTRFSPYAINPKGWRTDRLQALNDLVYREYATKRESKKVLDIKETIYVPTYYIQMTPSHRDLYKRFVESYFRILQKDQDNSATKLSLSQMVRANIIGFHACVDNPEAVLGNKRLDELSDEDPFLVKALQDYSYERDCPKLDYLEEILEERIKLNGEKGIIWYNHPATGKSLSNYLRYKNYKYTYVCAGMHSIREVVDGFCKDPNQQVLLASLNVMNTSVTVTEAKFNVWMERTYSPVVYQQCLGRIARYGQQDLTRNYVLAYDKSLDKLQELILSKGDLILEKTLNKDFLSMDEWSLILNGKPDELI